MSLPPPNISLDYLLSAKNCLNSASWCAKMRRYTSGGFFRMIPRSLVFEKSIFSFVYFYPINKLSLGGMCNTQETNPGTSKLSSKNCWY